MSAIGARIPRREDVRLLRGRGTYVDDIPLENCAHVAMVRSHLPHARIDSIDVSEALALPGVIGVYTAADAEEVNGVWRPRVPHAAFRPAGQRALAADRVRYVGEPVAIVVAESRAIAEDATGLVQVEYTPLEGSGTSDISLSMTEPIHPNIPDNIAGHHIQTTGDVDAAFASAPHVIKDTFTIARGGGQSMEGRVVAARYDPSLEQFTVWGATQSPHNLRLLLAGLYGVAEEQVRVIAPPDVGGGFGPKGQRYSEEVLVPWLARMLGRPVKFVEDRYEHFVTSVQEHPQRHEIEVAFDDDGRLIALRDVFVHDAGAYTSSLNIPIITSCTVPGPYRIPNIHVEFRSVYTNKVPSGSVRGAGRPQGVYVMDRMIDRVATELGLDPAQVRLKNLVGPDELPYDVGLIFRDGSPLKYDSGDYPQLLRTGLDLIGYDKHRALQAELRAQGVYRGIGISVGLEGVGLGPFEGATVRVENSGRVTAIMGAPAQGQGYETAFAQVVADGLGIDPDLVDIVSGDTARLAYSAGTFASRVAANAGPALSIAAAEVKQKLFASVAAMLEVSPDDLEIQGGKVQIRGTDVGIELGKVARAANVGETGLTMTAGMVPGLTATNYFNAPQAGYSSSCQVCVVDVDVETGEITIVDWVVGHDCGVVINPLIVEGQVLGGIAHGLSNALYEESIYDADGNPLTTTFLDYPLPSAHEMPHIKLYHQETPSPLNPLGVKGAGEAGTLGVTAVISGAVEDALRPLGVRLTYSPLSPGLIADIANEALAAARS